MDRNREARRTSVVGSNSNGFNRRKHRTNSLRDSPDEEGGVELQESVQLRERVKKDRDRERERDLRGRELRERERERDLRERSVSRNNKRRCAERLMSNRDEIGTSDDSENNDDMDEEYEETTTSAVAGVRFPATAVGNNHHGHVINHHHNNHSEQQQQNTSNSGITNSNQYHHLQHRKSFPPISSSSASKIYKTAAPVWKPGDEMIGVSVPRKARSASTKRLHDWASSSSQNNGGGGDQNFRQASNSPVRTGLVSTSTPSPVPPMSPSTSNASARKKLKQSSGNANGPKQKPPKASLKPCSSNPEELEIEIAEVLYGLMTQSQAPSSKKEDSPKEINRSTGDSISRASPSTLNTKSANNPIPEPNSTPLTAVAPKRKRPRQVLENSSYGARAGPKPEMDQAPKLEISSPNLERISGSTGENGFEIGGNLVNTQVQPAPLLEEPGLHTESKPEVMKETRDLVAMEEASLSKEKESAVVVRTEDFNRLESVSIAIDSVSGTEIKGNPVQSEIEILRQEKFQIDLMAPPPQVRSSPERESGIDSGAHVVEEKPVLSVLDVEMKSVFLEDKENENGKRLREESANVAAEEKKGRAVDEDAESEKGIENKLRSVDLKLDLANDEKDGVNVSGNRAFKPNKEELLTEKTGQSTNPLPLPMSMASWPGGLPPMGYMAPLQGVVPMDGTTVPPTPLQQSFAHPRPKRCATHCFIARNIHSLQQFLKMNPFFTPPAPGPTALFGSKPFRQNFMPAPDMQNVAVRAVQDKGQSIANVQNHGGVKEKSSQSASTPDSAQRKQPQILIQQALPSVPPSNLMAPAFIFPMNQHQAAMAAASVRPNTGKSSNGANTATATSSNVSNSAAASTPAAPAGGATNPMNFNYPNMPVNETQYLAILQNNGYPFTIPAVGPPTNYRGTPGQAMPFGSFYPSQMIHPSQIQPSSAQIPQNSNASGNSSSQKNSQRSHPGNSNPQSFASQKPQQLQQVSQSQQPSQNQHRQQQRNHENEMGGEDSPSTNLRASVNIYGQNFTMPIHPQSYAMVTPPNGSGNQSEKKPQQAQQQPPHSFAMSFGSINGPIPGGIDLASMAQNHAFFQSFPEAARQNMQMMAAAQVAQKKNFRISEEGNNNSNNRSGGGDSSATDDERKNSKSQSIAFTRSDLPDPSAQASNVVESSGRPGPARNSQAMNSSVPSSHIQSQTQQQQHQQQMMQLMQHRQQQLAGNSGTNRNKTQVSSNGSLYPEHINSPSSMAAKFPNAISGFPQNLVPSISNSPNQSPPWKSSSRIPPTSQAQSSLASSNPSTIKNLPQQQNSQIRPQIHTQISFGGSQKRSTNSPGQAPPNNSPAPSAIGSPTTSSVSKGAGGSPRITNSASTNKMSQTQVSALSAQHAQNSQAQKSLSILGNPSSGKQQSQQQMPKNTQQAQLFFSNPYTQAQSPHSTGSNSGHGGYFMQQRRRPEQQQQAQGGSGTSSNGMLSLGSSTGTNDPAKAIAAATSNMKVGGLPTQGMMHAAQFAAQSSGMVLPAGFAYVHPVPTAVQVKPAEQKQPAA